MKAETPAQLFKTHYPVIAPLIMCKGVGDGITTSCVMAQAATIDALRKGLTLDKPTDKMECACPVLCRLAIGLNDGEWWKDCEERTTVLRPLIPLLLDSRQSTEVTGKRVFFMANQAVKVLTPMRLRWILDHCKNEGRKAKIVEGIAAIEALPDLIDKAACLGAHKALSKLRASASASVSASAHAHAYASAYASAYAYAYADADADASADVQRVKYRDSLLQAFRDCAKIAA